jgi:hypothetical protein
MELEEKFDWLGGAAQGDVACNTFGHEQLEGPYAHELGGRFT